MSKLFLDYEFLYIYVKFESAKMHSMQNYIKLFNNI